MQLSHTGLKHDKTLYIIAMTFINKAVKTVLLYNILEDIYINSY